MKWKHSVSPAVFVGLAERRKQIQAELSTDRCTSPVPESSPLSSPLPQLWYQDSHQTHQKGLLGLVSAFDALCIKLALLQAAVHDVHGTGHTSLEVLEGCCWKALLQLVAQNLPMGQAEHTQQILQENNRAVCCAKGQHFGWAVAWKSIISWGQNRAAGVSWQNIRCEAEIKKKKKSFWAFPTILPAFVSCLQP